MNSPSRGFALLALLALVAGLGAVALRDASDLSAVSPPATTAMPLSLGGPTRTGVESLPVPSAATRLNTDPCKDGVGSPFPCSGEVWALPAEFSLREVREWYSRELVPGRGWGTTWSACFDGRYVFATVEADGERTAYYSWSRAGSERLYLNASQGSQGGVKVEVGWEQIEMPCQ